MKKNRKSIYFQEWMERVVFKVISEVISHQLSTQLGRMCTINNSSFTETMLNKTGQSHGHGHDHCSTFIEKVFFCY